MVVADGKRCNLEIGKKGNKLPDFAWPAYCPLPVMHCHSSQKSMKYFLGTLLKGYVHNLNASTFQVLLSCLVLPVPAPVPRCSPWIIINKLVEWTSLWYALKVINILTTTTIAIWHNIELD